VDSVADTEVEEIMDTSEQYIKMCEKAEEIQRLRPIEPPFDKWEAGDFYAADCPLGPCVSVHNDAGSYGLGQFTTWLPRQDQLQEMMMPSLGNDFIGCAPFILNERLHDSLPRGIVNWGASYEELWLAFVMKKRYNKIWNGEDWKHES